MPREVALASLDKNNFENCNIYYCLINLKRFVEIVFILNVRRESVNVGRFIERLNT